MPLIESPKSSGLHWAWWILIPVGMFLGVMVFIWRRASTLGVTIGEYWSGQY